MISGNAMVKYRTKQHGKVNYYEKLKPYSEPLVIPKSELYNDEYIGNKLEETLYLSGDANIEENDDTNTFYSVINNGFNRKNIIVQENIKKMVTLENF